MMPNNPSRSTRAKSLVHNRNGDLHRGSFADTSSSSSTKPRPAQAGLALFWTHASRKPKRMVLATSRIAMMTVKRVRLRSITCVAPNCDWPMPKAPDRPVSLPDEHDREDPEDHLQRDKDTFNHARSLAGSSRSNADSSAKPLPLSGNVVPRG
jgi:hypothetical protein